LRVALVNNFFPPRAGGSAHLTAGLARRLAAVGVDVLVVTGSYADAPPDETRDGYRVVRVPSWSIPQSNLTMRFDVNFTFSPGNVRRVASLLDEFDPDVLHQHGQFFDLSLVTSFYARRRRLPTILSVHTRLEHTSRVASALLAVGDFTVVRASIAVAHPYVVVMDRQMERYILRRYGVRRDRLVPIPVGVEPMPPGRGDRVRQSLGLGRRPIVLSVGHVIAVRDRLALVEAKPGLIERCPDVAVVVVGTVYDDRFQRRAAELGVSAHLFAIGSVAHREIPDYLAAADVETHDLQGYGLGTASLETMAAGVPVVACVPEDNFLDLRLRSGHDLVLVPPDDPRALANAVAALLDDPDRAARIGRGGRALVREHFTLDAVTRRHLELYERASPASAPSPP